MFKTLAHPDAKFFQRMIDLYEDELARTNDRIAKIPTPDITTLEEEEFYAKYVKLMRATFVTRLVKLTRWNPTLRKQFYQNAPAPVID